MKSITIKSRPAPHGFTLIELMIVVAIVGILATAGISQYTDYIVKAKIANAQTAIEAIKTAVAICAQEGGGDLTGCNAGVKGVPTFGKTKEVESATVTDGVIVASFASDVGRGVDGKTVTFSPSIVAGAANLTWNVSTTATNMAAVSALTKNNMAP